MGLGEIVTLVIAAAGGITGFYSVMKSARKSDVEALSGIIDKLNQELARRDKVICELERQIEERDRMIADLKAKLEDVQCWADDLVKQIVNLGVEPVHMRKRKND